MTYMATAVALYVVFRGWDLFNAVPVQIQNLVGAIFVIGILRAGLLVIPLYLGISLITGNVFLLGDSIPFLTEFMLALAVFLNSLLIDALVRGRLRRRDVAACAACADQQNHRQDDV